MKGVKFLVFFVLVTFVTCSLGQPLAGGFRQSNNIQEDQQFKAIDLFVKQSHPELEDAQVISLSTQIVSGKNFKILYQKSDGSQVDVVVYDQPWTGTRRITRFKQI